MICKRRLKRSKTSKLYCFGIERAAHMSGPFAYQRGSACAQTRLDQHPAPLGLIIIAACIPFDGRCLISVREQPRTPQVFYRVLQVCVSIEQICGRATKAHCTGCLGQDLQQTIIGTIARGRVVCAFSNSEAVHKAARHVIVVRPAVDGGAQRGRLVGIKRRFGCNTRHGRRRCAAGCKTAGRSEEKNSGG